MDRHTKYIPCLKTTDSELRAFRELRKSAKKACLPIFELTRSRTTSKNPTATVQRRLNEIAEIGLSGGFIVDLTTEESLQNAEIVDLFDAADGYSRWLNFVDGIEIPDIIPTVQINIEGTDRQLQQQVESLFERYASVALRLPVTDQFAQQAMSEVFEVADARRLLLILDCGYVTADTMIARCESATALRDQALEMGKPQVISAIASSFPSSVASFGDGEGVIPLFEPEIDEAIRAGSADARFMAGDFALIHPQRYPTRGGTWIPRIDFPTNDQCIYRRVRREDGGYITAASTLVETDDGFDDFECWGTEQIRLAAAGTPPGRNPSFWISVRSNIHMERRVDQLT